MSHHLKAKINIILNNEISNYRIWYFRSKSAYYLSKKHKVDLFEKEDHFSGHSHTIDIKIQDNIIPVDIGFIVFNKKTYPHLINFFEENNIAIEKSNMSFSVSVRGLRN